MRAKQPIVGQILLARKLITESQLKQALALQEESSECVGEILLRCGYVSEEMLVRALASQAGLQPWNLKTDTPTEESLALLTPNLCQNLKVLPVALRGDLLLVAIGDPTNTIASEKVRRLTGHRVEPVLAYGPRLDRAIADHVNVIRSPHELDVLVVKAMGELDQEGSRNRTAAELKNEVDTRPVVGLVNRILTEAIRMKASDVHLEPREAEVDIRFRLDGRLAVVDSFPSELMPMVVTRIKIMAEIDIVEFRVPQDGRISVKLDNRDIDMRVSVLPNYHGPRIVMRLHDRRAAMRPIETLGFNGPLLSRFRELLTKPYGMVLVTGPTGSGKTTTLYAALNEVRNSEINILTVEDPIEFDIPGVNQSQVNEKAGLTFAKQLRAILRQDPDVILVGEIRDHETAEIALRASMTGHLLLSTLHANDAMAAIPRLVDIGLPHSLISTSLLGVLAQRLVRSLCPDCKIERDATLQERALLELHGSPAIGSLCAPAGCPRCNQTGYRGRVAVGELLSFDREMLGLVGKQAPQEEILALARPKGFESMACDAARRIASGQTSFEEAMRVVFFESADPHSLRPAA